jgi:surfeit locus 1 family protein
MPAHTLSKIRFRKPQLVPLLFIIGAVALLTSLGVWQLERLQWKNGIIAHIQAAQAAPALGTLPQDVTGLDYRNVALTGSFINDKTMHVVGSMQGSENGFSIVTPFRLEDDGRIVLVNRGFSPVGKESKPEGEQTVRGIIRPLYHKRMFSPENRPDKNIWFYEDIPAMAQFTGLALSPVVIQVVGQRQAGVYPIPGDGSLLIRNDHLSYAITWLSLAVIAIVMFGFYHRKPEEK